MRLFLPVFLCPTLAFLPIAAAQAGLLADARQPLFALAADGHAEATLSLPVADGVISAFRMVDSGTLPRELMRRYPAMRSFRGSDEAGRTARLDFADGVARLSIRDGRGGWQATDAVPVQGIRRPLPMPVRDVSAGTGASGATTPSGFSSGNVRYSFRLALAASQRVVARYGGTRAGALGAIVHLANRANDVFENDLGVHFTLAARTDRLLMTDAEGDPLRIGEPRTAAAELIRRRLPARTYDVGHALLALEGGETTTGTSCSDATDADYLATHKAAAWSGGSDDARALAHMVMVLGNQLGAPFRATTCRDCLAFDGASIERVRRSLASRGGRCARKQVVEATAPWIDPEALADSQVIPARTPFWLDAAVEPTMPERKLTYAWDDVSAAPLFTTSAPVDAVRRDVSDGLPESARWLDFRLTVRDNAGPDATVASADTRLQVVDTGGAFTLDGTDRAVAGEPLAIHWDPAGTAEAPVSCHFLNVDLSRDDGVSWQRVAEDVRNVGDARIDIPAGAQAARGRLRISCDWRPFYAESPGAFRIL